MCLEGMLQEVSANACPPPLSICSWPVAEERILGYVDLWSELVQPLYCPRVSFARFFVLVNVVVSVSCFCSVGDVLPLSSLWHTEMGSNISLVPKHHLESYTRAGRDLMHWVDCVWALHCTWALPSSRALTNVDTSVLCLVYKVGAGPRIGSSAWNMLSELHVHTKLTDTKKAVSQFCCRYWGIDYIACVKGVTMPNLNTYFIPLWEADVLKG